LLLLNRSPIVCAGLKKKLYLTRFAHASEAATRPWPLAGRCRSVRESASPVAYSPHAAGGWPRNFPMVSRPAAANRFSVFSACYKWRHLENQIVGQEEVSIVRNVTRSVMSGLLFSSATAYNSSRRRSFGVA